MKQMLCVFLMLVVLCLHAAIAESLFFEELDAGSVIYSDDAPILADDLFFEEDFFEEVLLAEKEGSQYGLPEEDTFDPEEGAAEEENSAETWDGVETVDARSILLLYDEDDADIFDTKTQLRYTTWVGDAIRINADAENLTDLHWQRRAGSGKWVNLTWEDGAIGFSSAHLVLTVRAEHFTWSFRLSGKDARGKVQTTKAVKLYDAVAVCSEPKDTLALSGEKAETVAVIGHAASVIWQFQAAKGKKWVDWGEPVVCDPAMDGINAHCQFYMQDSWRTARFRAKVTGSSGKVLYTRICQMNLKYGVTSQPAVVKAVPLYEDITLSMKASGAKTWQWQTFTNGKWKNVSGSAGKKSDYTLKLTPGSLEQEYRCIYKGYDGKWHDDGETLMLSEDDVAPRTFRALIIANCYSGKNTLYGPMTDAKLMIRTLYGCLDGSYYEGKVSMEVTRMQLGELIENTFQGATENDISLFYFSGHGDYNSGVSGIVTADGYTAAGPYLKHYLDKVRGKKILIIDACYSGGLIGRGEDTFDSDSFCRDFISCFSEPATPRYVSAALAVDEYYVLTACSRTQTSLDYWWKEQEMYAGLFTRYFTEGAGLNFSTQSAGLMLADKNKDGCTTLEELYNYAAPRVRSKYKKQTVSVWPSGCSQVVFYR